MRMRSTKKKRQPICPDLLVEDQGLEVGHPSDLEKGVHGVQLRPGRETGIEMRGTERSVLGEEIGIEVNQDLVAGVEIGA